MKMSLKLLKFSIKIENSNYKKIAKNPVQLVPRDAYQAFMAPLVSLCIALLVGSTASIADTDAGVAANGHSTKEVSSSAASFFHSFQARFLSQHPRRHPSLSLSLS